MLLSRLIIGILSTGLLVLGVDVASAQDYPSKPIRILTSAVGGGGDFDSRIVAQGISGPLGQPVVVENRTSIISAEAVSKSPPDGYTLLITGGSVWVFPLMQKAPYEFARDFLPISLLDRSPSVLVVHPSVPVKTVKELIALAKAKPGELNYSHSGAGGPTHLGAELFKSMAGVNIVSVPYKGGAPALAALIGGEVHTLLADPSVVAPQVKSGKMRALAVTSSTPSALVPGLPTVSESGLPGYESIGYTGMWAPAKTPAAIINRIYPEVVRHLNQAEIKDRFLKSGLEVVASSPEQASVIINADVAKWSKLIKEIGIKAN